MSTAHARRRRRTRRGHVKMGTIGQIRGVYRVTVAKRVVLRRLTIIASTCSTIHAQMNVINARGLGWDVDVVQTLVRMRIMLLI